MGKNDPVIEGVCNVRHEALDRTLKTQTGKIEALTGEVSGMRTDFSTQFARINGKEEGLLEAETSQTTGKTLDARRRSERIKLASLILAVITALVLAVLYVENSRASDTKQITVLIEKAVDKAVNGKGRGGYDE